MFYSFYGLAQEENLENTNDPKFLSHKMAFKTCKLYSKLVKINKNKDQVYKQKANKTLTSIK